MARASKRAKTTATTATSALNDAESGGAVQSLAGPPQLFIPFQTGPSLERTPDDVLHEILAYLPTLTDRHVLLGHVGTPPVIPSSALVRVLVLRVLSQTSRLLRSRCLTMAWQRVELCGASLPKHNVTFFRVIGEATRTGVRVLNGCPHLLPLIQTVAVVLTRYQSAEIIPAFAACLATLPNLTSIQIVHAHSQMTTAIKKGFEGKRFPSVRRISLPSWAHEIIKCCPNLEEVICTEGDGSTIVGSLVKGNCHKVHILKGITAPLTRLFKLLPNLNYMCVPKGGQSDMRSLANFPLLDTIEIAIYYGHSLHQPLRQIADPDVKEATSVLKNNKSQSEKTVIVTAWKGLVIDADVGHMIREVIKV